MLLELAVLGLVGYGLIKNPEGTKQALNKMQDSMDKQVQRIDRQNDRAYNRGEISQEEYEHRRSVTEDYWSKR